MNKWLFLQKEFARTTLSATVSNFVEEYEFLCLHRQDSMVRVNSAKYRPTRQNIWQSQCIQHVQSIE